MCELKPYLPVVLLRTVLDNHDGVPDYASTLYTYQYLYSYIYSIGVSGVGTLCVTPSFGVLPDGAGQSRRCPGVREHRPQPARLAHEDAAEDICIPILHVYGVPSPSSVVLPNGIGQPRRRAGLREH